MPCNCLVAHSNTATTPTHVQHVRYVITQNNICIYIVYKPCPRGVYVQILGEKLICDVSREPEVYTMYIFRTLVMIYMLGCMYRDTCINLSLPWQRSICHTYTYMQLYIHVCITYVTFSPTATLARNSPISVLCSPVGSSSHLPQSHTPAHRAHGHNYTQ